MQTEHTNIDPLALYLKRIPGEIKLGQPAGTPTAFGLKDGRMLDMERTSTSSRQMLQVLMKTVSAISLWPASFMPTIRGVKQYE